MARSMASLAALGTATESACGAAGCTCSICPISSGIDGARNGAWPVTIW